MNRFSRSVQTGTADLLIWGGENNQSFSSGSRRILVENRFSGSVQTGTVRRVHSDLYRRVWYVVRFMPIDSCVSGEGDTVACAPCRTGRYKYITVICTIGYGVVWYIMPSCVSGEGDRVTRSRPVQNGTVEIYHGDWYDNIWYGTVYVSRVEAVRCPNAAVKSVVHGYRVDGDSSRSLHVAT